MPERRLIIGACAAWAEWSALSDLWLACWIVFSGVRPSTMHTPGVFLVPLVSLWLCRRSIRATAAGLLEHRHPYTLQPDLAWSYGIPHCFYRWSS